MEIEWKVDDGYVNNGPQHSVIDDEEIQNCETMDEVENLIDDYVKEDFLTNISWSFANFDLTMAEAERIWKEREDDA